MKKTISKSMAWLLSVVMIFGVFVSSVSFFDIASITATAASRYIYYEDYDNTVGIFEYMGNDENVIIPSVVDGKSVTSIDFWAFVGCTNLTSITISNSVTSIESGTLSQCTGLTNINVDINNSAYSSENGVLFNKNKAKILTYPAGKKGAYTIPNSVTSIEAGAFDGCTNLTSITIPNSVTSIGNGAFRGCTSLTNITIPNSVTSIEYSAFEDCTGLTSISIPNSVTSIRYSAFEGCTSLTNINVDINNNTYSSENGVLFNKNKAKILTYPAGKKGAYTIPNSVTSIGYDAFEDCTGLTSISIPNSVTSIGYDAFKGCTGLTSITIPNSVTSIGDRAFSGCTNLTSITIPNSVTSIDFLAFEGCTNLTSITIPNSVTSIGEDAFKDCTGLTNINVDINNSAYSSENGVLFNKNKTIILSYPIGKKGAYTIPNSVTIIGCYLFVGHTGLTSITIPNSVTSIEDYAFKGCTGLTNITIPNSVTSIEYSAFEDCTGLTSISIPNSVTSIRYSAFEGCTSLTNINVDINNNTYSSENGVLFNKNKAKILTYPAGKKGAYTIPNSVTSIGYDAFKGCTGLTSITIPNSVTSIGGSAFKDCTRLTSINVDINNSTYSSENGVLFNKNKAKILTYPAGKKGDYTISNSVTSIGYSAFEGCIGLTSITIPNSVTFIGDYAFYGCSALNDVYYTGTEEEWQKTKVGSRNKVLLEALIHFNYRKVYTEINAERYRFYFDKTPIVPGDTFIVGADKLGGNYTGTYYPGPGKVEWEISNRDVIDFIPITDRTIPYYEDSTQLHLKAKKFGESTLTLKLNGKTVCSKVIRVTLPKEKVFTDYNNELFKTNVMGILQNSMSSGTKIINNYSEGDKNLISLMTALKEDLGIKVILKELLAKIGLSSSMLDDAVDDVVIEMMHEYLSTEEFLNGTVSDINKKYKNLMKVSKFTALLDDREYITKIGKNLKKYSSFSESKIGDLLGKLNNHVGKGLNLAELACTAIMIAQIDRDAVCHLMTAVSVGGGYGSDIYNGLSRLLDRIDNLDNYIIEKYFYLSGCIFSKKIYLILCWNL